MRHNQTLIATIIRLSQELHDQNMPQVAITFQEHSVRVLKFHVVLLRLLPADTDPETLLELSKNLPPKVRFIPERVAKVGLTDYNYIKEANVFSLEIASDIFLTKNRSVHLVEARNFVSKALEAMIGPFRECMSNGSLVEKIASLDEENHNLMTLRLHLPRAAQSLDPLHGVDRTSGLLVKMLYEGLCRMNEKDEVELALANEVTISADKKKYVFSLRETCWSNGAKLTAYDFEYAWKQILEPDIRSPYCFLFFPIKNAEAIKRGEKPISQLGLHVLDDQTLLVQLAYPTPFFLDLTANWIYSPLCRDIDRKHPGWAYQSGETHVGNGPFKLEAWNLDDSLQIKKNPHYWDAKSVKLDKIHISIIEDEKKALSMFYAGELDWVGDPLTKIPPTAAARLQAEGLLHTDKRNFGLFWLQMNISRLPFQNTKIRKAFAYGSNRTELIENVLHSQDIPAYGFSYNSSPNLNPPFKDGDSELALQLFEEGLKELGITRSDLPPIVISHSEIEEQEALSRAIGLQWERLFGVEVKYNRMLWNSYFDALNRNDLHIGGIAWFTRFSDPLYYYNLFIFREHSVRITTWKNPVYQKLVEEAKQTADAKKKEALLAEAEKILLDAMPVIPLFYQKLRYVKNPRLKNAILSLTNQIDFRAAYLEEIE